MDDVTKHTIKIVRALRSPATPLTKKITEIFLEILIITFAVSLGQFLEKQREESIQQKEVKEFLLGLRYDLKDDVSATCQILKEYDAFKRAYTYMAEIQKNSQPNKDSLNKIVSVIDNNAFLRPNISRFEGFKSSGKLEEIGNKHLLQDILYFYQQAIPQLQSSERDWLSLQNKLHDFFLDNQVQNPDGTNNNWQLIVQTKAHNLCRSLIPWPQLLHRYQTIVDLGTKIQKEITKEYPSR